MPPINNKLFDLNGRMDTLRADFLREMAEIEAESIGWQPLSDAAYLHVGDPEAPVITVVGVPRDGDAVLLVGW